MHGQAGAYGRALSRHSVGSVGLVLPIPVSFKASILHHTLKLVFGNNRHSEFTSDTVSLDGFFFSQSRTFQTLKVAEGPRMTLYSPHLGAPMPCVCVIWEECVSVTLGDPRSLARLSTVLVVAFSRTVSQQGR